MTKISPVNGHLQIEPLKHEGFIATQRETYEEIGTVISYSPEVTAYLLEQKLDPEFLVGCKVFFDSWLAAKYPVEGGKPDEFYWLVQWSDVRAVDYAKPTVSE